MNHKHELINHVIAKNNYKTYLELGIGAAKETWNQIQNVTKTGVDFSVHGPNIHTTTTDAFFKYNTAKYDVIYIDADHEESSVMRDFENSLRFIEENGIIFMHDVGPENFENTALTASGTAYLAWIKIRSEKYYARAFEFPNGDVIGMVFVNKIGIPLKNVEYSWDFYNQNKKDVLNFMILDELDAILTNGKV